MEFKGLPDPALNPDTNTPAPPFGVKVPKEGQRLGGHDVSAQVSSSSQQNECQKIFDETVPKSPSPTPNGKGSHLGFEEASKILKSGQSGTLDPNDKIDRKVIKVATSAVYHSLVSAETGHHESVLKDVQHYSSYSADKLLKMASGNDEITGLLKVGLLLKKINEDSGNIRAHFNEFNFENVSVEVLQYLIKELTSLYESKPDLVDKLANELFDKCHRRLTDKSTVLDEKQMDRLLYIALNLRLGGEKGIGFHEFDSLEAYPSQLLDKMDKMIDVRLKPFLDDVKFLNELKNGLVDRNLNHSDIRQKIDRLNNLKEEYPNSVLIESIYDLANQILKEQSLVDAHENGNELAFDLVENILIQEGDKGKLGLDDFKAYSDSLIDKLIQNPEINDDTKQMLLLSKILNNFEKQLANPENIQGAVANLKNQLHPESLTIDTAQRLYTELEKLAVPQLTPFMNELKQIIFEKFMVIIHGERPGSAEFEEKFDSLSRATIKLCVPLFLKEVFLEKKQYKDSSGIYISGSKKDSKIDKDNASLNLYKECLEGVLRKFPEIEDEYLNGLIFQRGAIDLLVQKLKSKEGSPFAKVDYQSFGFGQNEKLLNAIKNIDRANNQQLEWLIQYQYGPHVTPMHIRVQDGHIDFIVTDSLGNYEGENGVNMHKEFTENMSSILSNVENNEHISVHWGEPIRQVDGTNCPILSLADMKEFINHPELFDEIKEMSKAPDNGISGENILAEAKTFNDMPVRLMRYNQSVTKLNAKLKELEGELAQLKASNTPDTARIGKVEGDIKLLNQMIAKNVKKGKVGRTEKDFNVYAIERHRKYEAIIVSQLLEAVLATT